MLAEWLKYFNLKENRITPKDNFKYFISKDVIIFTENVLKEYGRIDTGHEGLVYWAGVRNNYDILINTVIAPETDSSVSRVTIHPTSNFYVALCLSTAKIVHLGQVHSHPGDWVGHSGGDDARAAYKRDGILSIVISNYGSNGVLPLRRCGIHRYQGHMFIRLSIKYINKHFKLTSDTGQFFDLRDKKDVRWTRMSGIN